MKTLLFNGCPRPKGDTAQLLERFMAELGGEIKMVRAYDGSIRPCVDCRYCWEHDGCAIQDGMTEVYRWIEDCDNIVLASPVYFSEITGQLLAVLSRLQTLFCAHFFRGKPQLSRGNLQSGGKRGMILLVGGGDGSMERAAATARVLLHQMGVSEILPLISFHDTNHRPAAEDAETCRQLSAAAQILRTPR